MTLVAKFAENTEPSKIGRHQREKIKFEGVY